MHRQQLEHNIRASAGITGERLAQTQLPADAIDLN
jgi:hypothetical protein